LGIDIFAKLSYDASYHRTSIYEEIDTSKETDHYHRIRLFNEKLEYTVNLKTQECKITALEHKWHRFGVPSNATFLDTYEIGTDAFPHGGVLVNAWHDTFLDEKWHGTFTDLACLPVHERIFTNATGHIWTSFYDVTLGISNPNIFVPPKGCQTQNHRDRSTIKH